VPAPDDVLDPAAPAGPEEPIDVDELPDAPLVTVVPPLTAVDVGPAPPDPAPVPLSLLPLQPSSAAPTKRHPRIACDPRLSMEMFPSLP